MILIPAIDLRAGRCVRLYQGDFAAETRYDVEPHELLTRYRLLGAGWLHVVDLDGARDGTQANREAILALASQTAVRIQVGGGLRDRATVDALLRSGVARAVIGSAAITQAEEVKTWLHRFGPEAVVLAFDVRLVDQEPICLTHGWREQSPLTLWQAVENYLGEGLRHVLCTDVSRDGALSGPNLDLYRTAVTRYPQIHWQASGGIRDADDLKALAVTGAAAAISGRALLEQRLPAEELQPFLPNA